MTREEYWALIELINTTFPAGPDYRRAGRDRIALKQTLGALYMEAQVTQELHLSTDE